MLHKQDAGLYAHISAAMLDDDDSTHALNLTHTDLPTLMEFISTFYEWLLLQRPFSHRCDGYGSSCVHVNTHITCSSHISPVIWCFTSLRLLITRQQRTGKKPRLRHLTAAALQRQTWRKSWHFSVFVVNYNPLEMMCVTQSCVC